MTDGTQPGNETITPRSDRVNEWISLIEEARRDMRDYIRKCERIRKKYRYESSLTARRRRFQMLWSNIEILKPAVYAKRPSPSVSNRWKDGDAVARMACELVERNLDFQFDIMDYDYPLRLMRDDFLLLARGVVRLRYEPVFKTDEVDPDNDGFSAAKPEAHSDTQDEPYGRGGQSVDNRDSVKPDGSDEDGIPDEGELDIETIALDYIHGTDFLHPKCRTWPEVPWISFTSYMSREALIKRFGKERGSEIQLDAIDDGEDRQNKLSTGIAPRKATVYEIWDKTTRKVVWVSPGCPEILDECEPYLKLEGFFPCPRPAYGTLTADSLEPIPDYVFYQDQAEEIDQLTARIGALTDALKLVGFYPAGPAGEGSPEIEQAVRPGFENKMIAVKSWAAFQANSKGSSAPVAWLPVDQVVGIIKECVELRKQLVDDVYQLTGISDIIRGNTEAEETAAAQGLKSQWGSVRLKERQNELARVGRDITRMAAEIMANHFQVTTMVKVANMKIPTEAEQQAQVAQYKMALQQWTMQQMANSPQGGVAPPPASARPPGGTAPPPSPGNAPGGGSPIQSAGAP